MITKKDIINCIICYLLGCIIGAIIAIYYHNKDNNKNNIKYNDIDTTYNKIKLDSIEYNITKKDSIITEIKKKFEYEKDKAINASDSDAIKQFIELASE